MKKLAMLTLSGFLYAACAHAAPPTGGYIVESSPDMPGFTRIVVHKDASGYSGYVTSRWYGDLPMKDIYIEGDSLSFHLFNGNMRVPEYPIRITPAKGGGVRMEGRIWDSSFDLSAHPGDAAQMKALDFPLEHLPPRRVVKGVYHAKTPPMGWSSWNKFADGIDDRTVREIADAMVSSGLRDAGYVYVNIDDGWQGERDANGVLQPNAKFPDMKALADYVHARGLKLGLYSSPGPKSCAGYAGSYGHIAQDAKTYAAWGVDYLKYDLCSGEAFYHTRDKVYATYQQMGEALAATGRPILYSLCEYGRFDVGSWGRDVGGSLWRTTGDIEDSYASMAKIGFDKNGVPNHTGLVNGVGGFNDPDMLEIGNGGMSFDEYKTHMSLWTMMSAPLILGNDVRTMTPQTLSLLTNKEIIAVDQDRLGAQGLPAIRDATSEVWTKKLADGSVAVGVFNRADQAAVIHIDWARLGLMPAAIRDLWAHADLGLDQASALSLPAHGAAMLRVRSAG
jgi:alpha-galactosidase